MSDTPRTDARLYGQKGMTACDMAELCRELECELAAAIIERDNSPDEQRELMDQLSAANKIITESLAAINSPMRSVYDLPERIEYLVKGLSEANAKIAELENHLLPQPIDDGGPAFPCFTNPDHPDHKPGMSLRVWLAAQAMKGMLASMNTDETTSGLCVARLGGLSDFQAAMAAAAFGYADTMILASNDSSFSSYPERAVSLQTAADRPVGSISRIHQFDAKACCDMLAARKGGA